MAKAKILIVEDESIVALNIQNRLEGLGYTVVANVTSGEKAVQLVEETQPDLVLMDIKLKGKVDGIEAAGTIRNRFHIPVVYLTAYTDEETLNRAKVTESYGYILKPFEARDLSTTIEVALYNHRMEQQRHEKAQWLATTLRSMGDAVIVTDSEGLITFMNPVAEDLTCWKQDEVLGNDLTQVFQAINEITRKTIKNPVTLALQQGITVALENHTLLITKEGKEIPIDDTAAPIKNDEGKITGAVLVFHDVTEQQQAHATLQQTNEELGIKVEESNTQLRQINEQLRAEIYRRQHLENELLFALEKERELNELKSQIVTTVSHEYRTPLTTILSSVELLESYSSGWTEEKKQKHFERIKNAVQYLTKLVNDVLIVNQAQAREIQFTPELVDVESIVREVALEFQSNVYFKHTINVTYQGVVSNVLLDEKLLQSMLRHLLSNAVNYSPEGGEIQLELTFQHDKLVFRLSDHGIGISPTDQANIFNAFFRGSNVGTIPGVGLGLVIVKQCVDLHEGTIFVDSELGRGTTLTITLPLPSKLEKTE